VTAITPDDWSESDQKAIREHLVRILNSGPFHQAQRRRRFLEYIVNEALAGRGERLKGSNVAQAVFDRESFDPNIDPIVRMEAARVRDRLREYYETDGRDDPIRISLPKGTYTPHIEFRQAPTLDPRPARAAPVKQLMLAAAVLLIITPSLWGLQHWNSGPSLPDKPSVAVLPFDNIGTDPKWDRLGMTEDIITDLSRHRSQFHRALQGQAGRHPPNRSRPQREICCGGQHPIDGRPDSRDRPAQRSRLWQPSLVRAL
jgi:adenylate cyclase